MYNYPTANEFRLAAADGRAGRRNRGGERVGTHYEGTEREERALDAYVKLVRAYDSVATPLTRGLAREGLTTSQLGVLEALLHLGPLLQKELAEKLLTSPSNLTTVVDNLERDGHVQRRPHPEDRRCTEIHLTTEGRRHIEDVFPRHLERIAGLFDALAPEEQEELARLARKLGRAAAGRDTPED